MNNSGEYIQLFYLIAGVMGSLLLAGWGSAWWFSKKFEELHDTINEKTAKLEQSIITKLEYHERHDDERFADIKNDVWDIRVRNAARDGLSPLRSQDR